MLFYLLLLWKVMGSRVTAAWAEWFWAACLDKDLLRSGFLCNHISLRFFITSLHYPQLTEPVHIWFLKFLQKIMWFHLAPLLLGPLRCLQAAPGAGAVLFLQKWRPDFSNSLDNPVLWQFFFPKTKPLQSPQLYRTLLTGFYFQCVWNLFD